MVEEVDRGSSRQRWWRAAHQISSWRRTDFHDDPDAQAAADWMHRHAVRLHADLTERWVDEQHSYPVEWQDAATFSDTVLRLTPAQLRQINDDMWAVLDRYRHAMPAIDEREVAEPADGTEQVLLYLHSFPVRGPLPPAGTVDGEERS